MRDVYAHLHDRLYYEAPLWLQRTVLRPHNLGSTGRHARAAKLVATHD
ncbi:MAG: hypothetical protein PPP56_10130 [Longimonas sp.]